MNTEGSIEVIWGKLNLSEWELKGGSTGALIQTATVASVAQSAFLIHITAQGVFTLASSDTYGFIIHYYSLFLLRILF